MASKVELSGEAAKKRKMLPPGVKADVDGLIQELASSPAVPGRAGVINLDGVASDGTHYYVEILFHFDDGATALFVDGIEPEAY